MNIKISKLILLAAFALSSFVVHSGEEIRSLSSEATLSSNLGGTQEARLDFDFGTVRGWLREDGHWQIE